MGAGTRGASLGVQGLFSCIRAQSSPFLANREIHSLKNFNAYLDKDTRTHSFAKHVEGIKERDVAIKALIQNNIPQNKKAMFLTGDHSNALSIIQGLRHIHPHQKIGILWVDAHADLHSPFTTPSGNMHGMPLAAILNAPNIELRTNNPSPQTKEIWQSLCKAPESSQIKLYFAGLRDTEKEEDHIIDQLNIPVLKVEELREKGVDNTVDQIGRYFNDCEVIYISFDVDSLDPDMVSYGTGTPVKNGFSPKEVTELMCGIIKVTQKVQYFECTEINPLLDTKNKMAQTAFQILQQIDKVL